MGFKHAYIVHILMKQDPLNWPAWLKLVVLIQVSFLAFLGPFCQAVINAALLPLSLDLGISVTEASYQTTVPIVFAGVFPLLWSPVSNIYGRRPIFIFVSALGIASQCGAAVASTWGGILTARAFVGIGTSAGMGIGAAVVADMYFMHERGKYVLQNIKSLIDMNLLTSNQIHGDLCGLRFQWCASGRRDRRFHRNKSLVGLEMVSTCRVVLRIWVFTQLLGVTGSRQ